MENTLTMNQAFEFGEESILDQLMELVKKMTLEQDEEKNSTSAKCIIF